MIISRKALNEYLDRDLDSYLWMKRLRRLGVLKELEHLKVKPIFKTEPWLHQLVCFYIGICLPEFLFLLDMGLGKSKILSDLITQRIREKSISRALICVPNVVNMASWQDDLGRHSELEPWTCDVAGIEEKWERLSNPKGEVTVIDYHGLTLALCDKIKGKKGKGQLVPNADRIARVRKLYPFIGIDESQKLRNHQNLWFSIMRDLTQTATYTYATTGTPFGKTPESLWAQFYLVDKGETFGQNLGLFRSAFFGVSTDNFKGSVWTFNKRMSPDLNRMLQHRSIRYDEDEVPEIDLPKKVNVVKRVNMGVEQREHYLRALEGLINAQGMGDPAMLEAPWIRMRQIVSGYLVWEDDHGKHVTRFKENPKLIALEHLLSEMGESKIVICCDYALTGQMIVDHVKAMGFGYEWLYGGTKDKTGARTRFMNDPDCRVFVMNSSAGGTGNDGLQKVARYMVFYESPTPPDLRKQVEKRIHRPGQLERAFIYDLVASKTTDQGILDSIAEGNDLFQSIVNGRALRRGFLG